MTKLFCGMIYFSQFLPKLHLKYFSYTKLFQYVYLLTISCVALGGLVVIVLATGPKVRGFDPDRGR
jgi:hypothetical protein